MNRKAGILFLTVALTLVGVLLFSQWWQTPVPVQNWACLPAAVHAYVWDLQARRMPVPESVTLEQLVQAGFLRHEDAKAFDGMEVSFALHPNPDRPQESIIRVRMPNGEQLAVLGDGSVQELSRKR